MYFVFGFFHRNQRMYITVAPLGPSNADEGLQGLQGIRRQKVSFALLCFKGFFSFSQERCLQNVSGKGEKEEEICVIRVASWCTSSFTIETDDVPRESARYKSRI